MRTYVFLVTATVLMTIILLFANPVNSTAQKPPIAPKSCTADICHSATIGDTGSYSYTWLFFVGSDGISTDPNELPEQQPIGGGITPYPKSHTFCIDGSLNNLCPTYRLNISVYINGFLTITKNYSRSCWGASANDFYFTFTAEEDDKVVIQAVPVYNSYAPCSCTHMGAADVNVCYD